jgi:hypothetical protein
MLSLSNLRAATSALCLASICVTSVAFASLSSRRQSTTTSAASVRHVAPAQAAAGQEVITPAAGNTITVNSTLDVGNGATQTRALLSGSPALDAGDTRVTQAAHYVGSNIAQLTTDQRGSGFNRAVDANGDGTPAVDIGVNEIQDAAIMPGLGNYPNTTVNVGGNTTVTPDVAATNVTGVNVSSSTNFKGAFAANAATGVVRVTNAHPAGTYVVTITAFNGPSTMTRNFTLTVQPGAACTGASIFTNAADTSVGARPFSVAIGDFNGDGKQDIAAANPIANNVSSNNVSVHLGDGSGGFTVKPVVSVGSSPISIAIGDFNNDGNQDFATANQASNNVSIRLGDGSGGFTAKPDVRAGPAFFSSRPVSVAIGDFNNDGQQDIAVANRNYPTVSIRLGDGSGGFTGTTEVSVGFTALSVAIGDFNNDGKQDIAVANFDANTVSIRLGDGMGGFAGTTEVSVGAAPYSVAIGDFNNDGKQDIATANSHANSVSIRLGDGAGGFTSRPDVALGSGASISIAIGDFNNDGNQDVAVANSDSGNVSIRFGDGAGGLSGTTAISVGLSPESVAIGDFNGDGRQDIAVAVPGSATVSILLGLCNVINRPLVSLSDGSYIVNENESLVTITVNRTGNLSLPVNVDYATDDTGSPTGCGILNSELASSRCDFNRTSGTLAFAAGETQKTFTVLLNRDSYAESTERFAVNLSNVTNGAALIAPSSATVFIFDSQTPGPPNIIDDVSNFVRQHYHDFLNREPDQSGWDFWTNQITSCGNNAQCNEVRRIDVSVSFFLSIEFQQTGYLVERFYKVGYGDATGASTFGGSHQLAVPIVRANEFLTDTQRVGRGVVVLAPGWEQLLESNKQAYALEFVQTSRFTTAFPNIMTPAQFVDKLNQNAGNVLSASERTTAINLFGGAADSSSTAARAQAMRQVAEDQDLYNVEYNRAFVLAEYFGYLRRNPNDAPESTLDYTGYDFWLTKLTQFNGNYINAEMVKAFLSSIEYRQRFGP